MELVCFLCDMLADLSTPPTSEATFANLCSHLFYERRIFELMHFTASGVTLIVGVKSLVVRSCIFQPENGSFDVCSFNVYLLL